MLTSEEDLIFSIVIVTITFFILVGFMLLVFYNYYKARIEKEKEILKAVFQTQENERTRISEDLHDDIGATLSAIKIQNELIKNEPDINELRQYAENNSLLVDRAVSSIRAIVRNQASKYIIDNGLKHELEALIKQCKSINNVMVNSNFDYNEDELKMDFQLHLFRILQELLNNSLKHSQCSNINVSIKKVIDEIVIFYSDNGKGYMKNGEPMSSMGLSNIEVRIKMYRGKYDFKSVPGVETAYNISFPLKYVS